MKKDAQRTVKHHHNDNFELKMMVKKRYGEMNQISRSLHTCTTITICVDVKNKASCRDSSPKKENSFSIHSSKPV